jgi:long-subunit fatty acid transport protein
VQGRFTNQDIDTSQTSAPSPIAGVLVGPIGVPAVRARFAFVFREQSDFRIKLPASLTIAGLDVGLLLDIATQANFTPRSYNAGVSVEILEQLITSVDVQLAQWSSAPPPFIQVTNNVSGRGLDRLGLGDVLDAPAEGQSRIVAPGFVDTVNVRVGLEGRLLDDVLRVRGGYAWRPTPVPDQTSGTNLVDNSTHTLACGAGVRFSLPEVAARPFEVNASYQALLLQPRSAQKASGRDPVGSWTSSGVVSHVGLDLRYEW